MKVLSINQFAKICRTTPRTIRFYEEVGLFTPARVDEWTKYRYYTQSQAKDFLRIKLLQHFHIPLRTIEEKKRTKGVGKLLESQIESLQKELVEKQKEIRFLQEIQKFVCDDTKREDLLHEETFGPKELFTRLVPKADYDKVGEYITHIHETAGKLQIPCEKEELVFYHNSEYEPKNTIIEVALIVKKKNVIDLPEGCNFKTYPATKLLVYDYFGSYDYFILLYQKLFGYIQEKKIPLIDFAFDRYVVSQKRAVSVYDTHTKLCFPIGRV